MAIRIAQSHIIGEILWNTGDLVPEQLIRNNITEIEVSGEELSILKTKYTNIPMTTNDKVLYYGEMAKFVLHNLMFYTR